MAYFVLLVGFGAKMRPSINELLNDHSLAKCDPEPEAVTEEPVKVKTKHN
jgi:hypothetical protein